MPCDGAKTNDVLLQVKGVTKSFSTAGTDMVAIRSAELTVCDGEFVAIVGPSGCGKSTLLQIIAGLLPASGGEVNLAGKRVDRPPADMVYLFQQYTKSLFPWLTVEQNVAFAFEHRLQLSRADKQERCRKFLRMVKLEDFCNSYPYQLSGGMQQRVAIARALAAEPKILLMDEPFSSVDALTRLELQELVLEIRQRANLTIILVTHDVDEAVYLSDKVAVLSHRPSEIVEVIPTHLPRPRDPVATRATEVFLDLRAHLLSKLLTRPEPAP